MTEVISSLFTFHSFLNLIVLKEILFLIKYKHEILISWYFVWFDF
jgi:hypothetical protein